MVPPWRKIIIIITIVEDLQPELLLAMQKLPSCMTVSTTTMGIMDTMGIMNTMGIMDTVDITMDTTTGVTIIDTHYT